MAGHDPAHSHAETFPPTLGGGDWNIPIPNASRSAFHVAPALGGGFVYAPIPQGVAAFDERDGRLVWSTNFDTHDPVLADGFLITGLGPHALNASTGEVVWDAGLNTTVYGEPVVSEDLLAIMLYPGQNGMVLSMSNGSAVFNWTGVANADFSPAFYGSHLVTTTTDLRLVSYSLPEGTKDWESIARGKFDSPTVAGNVIYTTQADALIRAFNASTGELLWQVQMHDSTGLPATVYEDTVFAVDSTNTLWAVDAASGHVRWTTGLGENVVALLGLTATDYGILSLDGAGEFLRLSTHDGHVIERHRVGPFGGGPIAWDGTHAAFLQNTDPDTPHLIVYNMATRTAQQEIGITWTEAGIVGAAAVVLGAFAYWWPRRKKPS